MQLSCPNCGETIAAENINIQQMAAVCAACNTVFAFDLPDVKAKRRKVKRPKYLNLQEDDTLHMAFRTNFRLDRHEEFILSVMGSLFLTFMTAIMINEYLVDDISILFPVMFGLGALALYYRLALAVYNKTHIEMDDETIHVSRRPLPGLFNSAHEIDLSGVVAIRCEETPKSTKEGYDTPRYNVWAEMTGGNRKIIIGDLIDDYAFYVAQLLNERLDSDADTDIAHLVDDAAELERDDTVIEDSHLFDTH